MSTTATRKSPLQVFGLLLFGIGFLLFTALPMLQQYRLNTDDVGISNEAHRTAILTAAREQGVSDRTYRTSFAYVAAFEQVLAQAQATLDQSDQQLPNWQFKDYTLASVRSASSGPVSRQPWLFFGLTIGLALLGGLLYILPKFSQLPGIKHDHIYHSGLTRGLQLGWRAVMLGLTVVGVLLYGVYYMNDSYLWPTVTALVGSIIIGLVYLVQGSLQRQPARSASPAQASAWLGIFFGVYLIAFYVLLYWAPQHIVPWVQMVDPLSRALSGNAASQWFLYGLLYTAVMLVMGVRMFAKYRHNRYQLIRTASVVFFQTAFAFLIPEILVRLNQPWFDFKNIWPLDYDFFFSYNLKNLISSGSLGMFMLVWGIALIVIAVPVITYFYGKRWYCSWVCGCGGLAETMGDPFRQLSDKSLRAWKFERWIIHGVLVFAIIMTAGVLYTYFSGQSTVLGVQSGAVSQWYGFLIGSSFAGVVGTGFYPLMGNRVWCRFGCPLAAYLGLVQRFRSRFRITTNGSQCISCGNCSTYCEMGIDVRWYAQRGQDIVRSSCVGCGVCAAVCPRGVLRLENASEDIGQRASQQRTIHVPETEVRLLG